jgi:hypothetical protein
MFIHRLIPLLKLDLSTVSTELIDARVGRSVE